MTTKRNSTNRPQSPVHHADPTSVLDDDNDAGSLAAVQRVIAEAQAKSKAQDAADPASRGDPFRNVCWVFGKSQYEQIAEIGRGLTISYRERIGLISFTDRTGIRREIRLGELADINVVRLIEAAFYGPGEPPKSTRTEAEERRAADEHVNRIAHREQNVRETFTSNPVQVPPVLK
jgi:hypothetical protein